MWAACHRPAVRRAAPSQDFHHHGPLRGGPITAQPSPPGMAGRARAKALLGLPLPFGSARRSAKRVRRLFVLWRPWGGCSGPFSAAGGATCIRGPCVGGCQLNGRRTRGRTRSCCIIWNALAMLDLVVAIGLAQVASRPRASRFSRIRLGGHDANALSFVPTVLVPIWMLLHAIAGWTLPPR